MKKFTKKEVNSLLNNVETNFSELIGALIYFESIDKDHYSWDILHKIEELPSKKEIQLLIKDFPNRNKDDSLLYNSLWYALVNQEKTKEYLINDIKEATNLPEILLFIKSLDEGGNNIGYINIRSAIDLVNYNIA